MTASADLRQAADNVARFPDQAVRRVVTGLRAAITPRLRQDTGGDNQLSGAGNAKLSVYARTDDGLIAEGVVRTIRREGTDGRWRWLEDGTRPRTTAAGGQHPGTDPKRTWSDPIRDALPDVLAGVARDFEVILR